MDALVRSRDDQKLTLLAQITEVKKSEKKDVKDEIKTLTYTITYQGGQIDIRSALIGKESLYASVKDGGSPSKIMFGIKGALETETTFASSREEISQVIQNAVTKATSSPLGAEGQEEGPEMDRLEVLKILEGIINSERRSTGLKDVEIAEETPFRDVVVNPSMKAQVLKEFATRVGIGEFSPDAVGRIATAGDAVGLASSPMRGGSSPLTVSPVLPGNRPPGGIDLNPMLMDMQIKRDGNGIPLPLPLQPVENMHIDGFVPVIINITPVLNLPMLLGLADIPAEDSATGASYNQGLSPMDKKSTSKAREPELISSLN